MLQCQRCDYRTMWSSDLEAHLRKHAGCELQCQRCDYKTTWSGDIGAYLRKRQLCEYKAAYPGHLEKLMLIHTGENQQWLLCEYETVHSVLLEVDLCKHTGDVLHCQRDRIPIR